MKCHPEIHLAVREDRSIVSLQDRLYQGCTANLVYPLLSGLVPENSVEEETLRGLARIGAWVPHDDLSPVFLRLGDSGCPEPPRELWTSQRKGATVR